MGRKYLGGSGESLTVWISVLVYAGLTYFWTTEPLRRGIVLHPPSLSSTVTIKVCSTETLTLQDAY
jgi:hypothetical protein